MKKHIIDNIFQQWLELKQPLITKQTYRTYLGFYNNHIYPVVGLRDIKTIHFIDYQKLANNLLNSGLKPKTVKNIFTVLTNIYKFAKKNEWYTGEIFPDMIELPKYDNKFWG